MDVQHAASRLRSLASDNARRSKTAVLGDVYLDIENAVRAGVSQVVIVEELRRLGLDINVATFRSAMRRLRAKRGGWTAPPGRADFVRTTSAGSMYDEEAMCRLLRASGTPTVCAAPGFAD